MPDRTASATRTVTRNGTTYQQKVGRGPAKAAPAAVAAVEPAKDAFTEHGQHQEEACPPSDDEIAEAIAAEQAERSRILAILAAADRIERRPR